MFVGVAVVYAEMLCAVACVRSQNGCMEIGLEGWAVCVSARIEGCNY